MKRPERTRSTRSATPDRQRRAQRLTAQCLSTPADSVPSAVRKLLALQGQDLIQARWALAVRAAGATHASVDAAFAARSIVRGWCLRGTLHVVAAEDLPWLVRLLGPRNLARAAGRLRGLEISERDVAQARAVVEKHLAGRTLLRDELFALFEAAGQAVAAQRGVHLLFCLSQAGVLCQAGEAFALMDEWVRRPRLLDGDEALAALATRYREGHGPIGVDDLAFWAGIGKREAARALELAAPVAVPEAAEIPRALLLPGYDEYLLGYADRSPCIEPQHFERVVPGGNGVFLPMVVLDGWVRATWRRLRRGSRTVVTVRPFVPIERRWHAALEQAVAGLEASLGEPCALQFEP